MNAIRAMVLCGVWGMTAAAAGQCETPHWLQRFTTPGTGLASATGQFAYARCLQVFDPDGPGPMPEELYVGGDFRTAGGIVSPGIARWNGQSWSDVGGGILPAFQGALPVQALGLHDPDGPGPALPVLVAAGSFTAAGGVPAAGIAAWNGVAWSALGAPPSPPALMSVGGIADIDLDGPGPIPPRLVVAAGFEFPPGSWEFRTFAMWDGETWTLGPEFSPGALSMAVYDEDGPGPGGDSLYFGTTDAPGIYRWNGSEWNVVGGGLMRSLPWLCTALRVVDEDGPGPARPVLLAGGTFSTAGGNPALSIARWDGLTWTPMGAGTGTDVTDIVAVENPGQAPTIYVVGGHAVSRWNRGLGTWTSMGAVASNWPFDQFQRIAVHQGSRPAPSIYISGHYSIDGTPAFGLSQLTCECYANCDGTVTSPALTGNDFQCFLDRFVSGHSYANCDGSTGTPALTANDFQCFLNAYVAGCP